MLGVSEARPVSRDERTDSCAPAELSTTSEACFFAGGVDTTSECGVLLVNEGEAKAKGELNSVRSERRDAAFETCNFFVAVFDLESTVVSKVLSLS